MHPWARALTNELDPVTCKPVWKIRIVSPPEDLTPDENADPDGLIALRDADGCVKGWAVKIIAVEQGEVP